MQSFTFLGSVCALWKLRHTAPDATETPRDRTHNQTCWGRPSKRHNRNPFLKRFTRIDPNDPTRSAPIEPLQSNPRVTPVCKIQTSIHSAFTFCTLPDEHQQRNCLPQHVVESASSGAGISVHWRMIKRALPVCSSTLIQQQSTLHDWPKHGRIKPVPFWLPSEQKPVVQIALRIDKRKTFH